MKRDTRTVVYDDELGIEAYRLRVLCSLFRIISMNIMLLVLL